MLPSAGFFRSLPCPFDARGCRRPHCQYRHDALRRRLQGEPPVPQPRPLSGSSAQGLDKNIQELEMINKAIQSLKTEVEEQKKLFCYDWVQDFKNNVIFATNHNKGNKSFSDEGDACNSPVEIKNNTISISKESKRSSKYILDHSCPATDLEYDPLLNYSAGLGSSLKEVDKNDTCHSKHFKVSHCRDLQASIKTFPGENRFRSPRKRSVSSSPIKLQESDDDMLIIDAPPMNVSKKPRISKTYKKWNREVNEMSFGANLETVQNSGTSDILKNLEGERSEVTVGLHSVNQSDGNKSKIKISAAESAYLADVKASALNVGSKLWTKYYPATKGNNVSPQMKFEMNKETLKEESLNVTSVKACNMTEEVSNHKTLLKNKTQTNLYSRGSTKDRVTALQESSKKDPIPFGKWSIQLHGKSNALPIKRSCVPVLSGDTFVEKTGENCTDKTMKMDAKENEIIVLDSSEEDDVEEDNELSESDDTMEECRRIFNEFVEHEAQKERLAKQQALAAQTDVNLDLKTSMLPGQKRRIAHTAKFDVNTTKEIIVPLKAPLPQRTCHSRILKAQQQATQITTAVKSGQAFVAATCGPKRTASVIPATQIQSMGPIVCLNVFEVQPVGTSTGQVNVLLPGNALTSVPCRLSNYPVKKNTPKPIKASSRRRPPVIVELGSKVPHDTRQRYVNFFFEEFLKDCATVNEAFDKALIEEKAIYDRCGSKNIYLNIAVNKLKKLRDHSSVSADGQPSDNKCTTSTGFRKEEKNDFTGITLYKLLKEYALTDEQLKENGFPEPNPEKPGSAILCSGAIKAALSDSSRRICCRCGEIYTVTSSGRHVRKEECSYHSGRVLRHKVPGGLETRYSCCEGVVGSPGCQVAKLHVHDGRKENIDGFVKTFIKPPPLDGNHGVFALDCEMCYTTRGLELSRVTVVDPSLHVIYDTFVKPDNEIIDFNNRFSGVTAEDMKNTVTSIRDVQAILLNLFSADTILIGHSLESDLFALKLFHNKIVDTSVVFPHRLGLPHKRALRNLMADYLQRIIQDNVGGHDCSEDATACMELMLWKVKEDTKGRRY
ncbi:RNA exonuclease 1 homolog isoform X1 [Podarcis muralis]